MSNNPGIHVFTNEELKEYRLLLAAKIHQVTVTSTVRKLNKMNAGQVLNASRNQGKDLYWSEEKLHRVLDHIDEVE